MPLEPKQAGRADLDPAIRECLEAVIDPEIGLSIDVTLVWEPPWHPDLITDRGLEHLDHPAGKLT